MNRALILGLLHNAALLIALGVLYDILALRKYFDRKRMKFLTGFILGGMGIVIMLTPWEFMPGLIFDTRSILLSISGLFFGIIPTGVAMGMTVAFRIYQGGPGTVTGIAVILTSGLIGSIWRYKRKSRLNDLSLIELYIFGIIVHLVMLLCMFFLRMPMAIDVLKKISLPVMLIYPVGTMLLGKLLAMRYTREKEKNQLEKALREKEILLRELYHRTKNNMQVIRSMLILQAASLDTKEVKKLVRETENRILSMALVHQKLYQSRDLSRIRLDEYLKELTQLLVESNQISQENIVLAMDTEEIAVQIDTAIPCGLVVNELISNSFKHAFPDGRKGKISIQLRRKEDESIELRISDNGVGVPEMFEFREQRTLGIKTVVAVAEQQMQGTITFENNGGISCSLIFPDNLYESRV